MRVLLLNQTFHPDLQATAQHATDLARQLAREGHEVTVVAGRRAYGRPDIVYVAGENWEGIRVHRVGALDFGKQSRWRRALNFASFLGAAAWRLARLPRYDVTIAMTTPPLLSVLGALFARLRGGRLVLWLMDLNPDQAIAAGWLKPRSLPARTLDWLLCWSLRRADTIIVLDRFMRERVEAKIRRGQSASVHGGTRGTVPGRIVVIPPGARDQSVHYDAEGRREFRRKFNLRGKFVIMYSGNHSPCHSLETLLGAAERLRDDPRFAFCFIGGGSQFETVRRFAGARRVTNIRTLPYQPAGRLSDSLSTADLHAVVMGDKFVGILHPSKIYNALALGIPVLYIGPDESHITDLARRPASLEKWGGLPVRAGVPLPPSPPATLPIPRPATSDQQLRTSLSGADSQSSREAHSRLLPHPNHIANPAQLRETLPWFFEARHGEVERVVRHILTAEDSARRGDPAELVVAARFSQQAVVAKLSACVTKTSAPASRAPSKAHPVSVSLRMEHRSRTSN